ncbi:hypothetical protein ACKWTF_013989 [Chironomus riparius]
MPRRVVVDIKFVAFMFVSLAANYIKYTETAIDDKNDQSMKALRQNSSHSDSQYSLSQDDERNFNPSTCGHNTTNCSDLQFPCIRCTYELGCTYGETSRATCDPRSQVQCIAEIENGKEQRTFSRYFTCRYCFLTEPWEHDCKQNTNCNSAYGSYKTNCTVKPNVLCLGSRQFPKNVKCNWTRGSKYFTALVLSITLGGFGVDRFYLGHWQEGIGKLFSFGGLGVWVIVDSILISIGYLGTSDGSLLL